jgi:hypothetical protein
MPPRWHAPGGWRIEIVRLEHTPDHRDGEWYRLTQFGSHAADVRTVAEIAAYVDLATLEEDELTLAAA